MSRLGKKHQSAKDAIKDLGVLASREALSVVLKNAYANFDESVDADIVLGIDPAKGEQSVRGSVLLPHGIGKTVRVLVFAKGEDEDVAQKAGADFVGAEDLVEKVLNGWLDFDAAVATPDLMGLVGKVAKILGPRGLLPNKKVGTVTSDIAGIVSDLKKGRVTFKNDKGGVLHAPFGRVSFGDDKLFENLVSLVKAVQGSKPATSKGKFIRKITLSSTMGIGVSISPDELL